MIPMRNGSLSTGHRSSKVGIKKRHSCQGRIQHIYQQNQQSLLVFYLHFPGRRCFERKLGFPYRKARSASKERAQMDTRIPFPDEFLKNSIHRSIEDERRERTLRPTFFIGLGNTGMQVLVPLKKKLARFYDQLGDCLEQFQFLMLDIGLPEPSLADQMDKTDFRALSIDNVPLTVNHFKHSDSGFSQWWESEFMPLRKDLSDSTGGIRQLGRLAFRANLVPAMRDIESKLSASLSSSEKYFKSDEVSGNRITVFVVASSCGGIGSGIVIDLLFLLYRLFCVEKSLSISTQLFLVLPNGFIDRLYTSFKQFRLLHANTFALFRELHYLVSPEHRGASGFWRHYIEALSESEGASYESWKPFEKCYIIDNRAQGSRIVALERLFSRLTRVIFSMATTPLDRQKNRGRSQAEEDASPPGFYTIGFQELRYRSASVMSYLCNKLSLDLVKQELMHGVDDTHGSSIIAQCESLIEGIQKVMEEGLREIKQIDGLEDEMSKRKQETRSQVPRFMPFASVVKLINALEAHREFYQKRIEDLLPAYQDEIDQNLLEVKKRIVASIVSFVEAHIEQEGPLFCREVLQKLKTLFQDYQSTIVEREKSLFIRQSRLGEKISEIVRNIGEKKELSRNTEEFFEALEEYGDCYLLRNIGKQNDIFISGLLSHERLREIHEQLLPIEQLLRSLQKTLQMEMEVFEGIREKEISTLFFPKEELDKSEALLRLYRNSCSEASFPEHKKRFLQVSRDFMPLSNMYLNLDKDSAALLLSILYRYGATVFLESTMVTALKGIPRFLRGGVKELGTLLGSIIRDIEPVLLIDGSPDKMKKRLLWSTAESDVAKLEKFSPVLFKPQNFRFSPEQDEIFFITLFGPIPLDAVETLKLCQDHYVELVEKNRECVQSRLPVKFPLHLDRIWHQSLRTLPMIFPFGE
jgi:hypothetical protein